MKWLGDMLETFWIIILIGCIVSVLVAGHIYKKDK